MSRLLERGSEMVLKRGKKNIGGKDLSVRKQLLLRGVQREGGYRQTWLEGGV